MRVRIRPKGWLSLLTLSVAAAYGVSHASRWTASAADARQIAAWDAMIDAMANRNPAPRLMEVDRFTQPIFLPDYDWEEQTRVRRAFTAIKRNDDPGLWDRLVDHIGDKRYALTLMDNGPNAHNYTVGGLCHLLAGESLFFATRHRSDPDSGGRPDVYLDVKIDDLARWRKERHGKALYELQIEVCEAAIEQIPLVEDISDEAKARIRLKIEKDVAHLKKTKVPFIFKPAVGGFEFFDAESAQKVRELAR